MLWLVLAGELEGVPESPLHWQCLQKEGDSEAAPGIRDMRCLSATVGRKASKLEIQRHIDNTINTDIIQLSCCINIPAGCQ